MTNKRARQILTGPNSKYLKNAQFARVSGTSRQDFYYWLSHENVNCRFNPTKGFTKLKLLCLKLTGGDQVNEGTFKEWKKFINLSELSQKFCGVPSSSMAVTISRKGINHYNSEIKQMASFIHEIISNGDVKKGKGIAFKINLP